LRLVVAHHGGKRIVRRIGQTNRYEPLPVGLRAMTALVVLRDKANKAFD